MSGFLAGLSTGILIGAVITLGVTGTDIRLALALFALGTIVESVTAEGNQWLNRWITSSDPDR